MEIRRGGNVVIFTGNSLVSRGDSRLSADVLTQDKKNNRVEAAGNVAFRTYNRAQELLAGTAGRGWYDLSARTGALWTGRPLVAYHMKSSTGPLTLEAERIEFNETTEEVTATGAVEIVSSSMTARAPQARFFQQARKVILTNGAQQPELIYRGADGPGHYQADTITVFVDRRRIIMEGNARGRMVVQTDDAHKAETNAAGKQKP
jgi:lipopolysaccharide export system protein LptA